VDVKWGIYTLEQELGRGGMAVVYRASKVRDGDFKRTVCLKRIRPELSDDPEFVRMFRQEASVAASLHHPNIVAVTDFDQVEGQLFLEMELVDGIDLAGLLDEVHALGAAVPLEFARYVASCLLAALAHAHGRAVDGEPAPVIHRDLSPANVLVSTEGELKLADFGIAKVRGSSVVTEVGDVKGKFAYLSPEQARGEEVDPRSDLYSAGLVLYELLCGRRFNSGEDQRTQLGQAVHPGDPRLTWLSDEWNELLARLLAEKREDRFAGADEALAALAQLPAGEPYDREEAGRLVRVVRELANDRDEPLPTRLGPADGPTRARPQANPTPLAVARTTDVRPGKRRLGWLQVAAALAVVAGLFLLANELFDPNSADQGSADPASPAASDPEGGVAPVEVEVTSDPVADSGSAPSSAAADAGAARDGRRPRDAERDPGSGRLEVNCRPWAHVSVDGRAVGVTPIRDLKVRAGKRRVTLRNAELDYERTFTLDVPRGGVGSLTKDITLVEPNSNPYTRETN